MLLVGCRLGSGLVEPRLACPCPAEPQNCGEVQTATGAPADPAEPGSWGAGQVGARAHVERVSVWRLRTRAIHLCLVDLCLAVVVAAADCADRRSIVEHADAIEWPVAHHGLADNETLVDWAEYPAICGIETVIAQHQQLAFADGLTH